VSRFEEEDGFVRVFCILDMFWCMMAVILNIMEVLEVWHGCFVSWVVGIGL
jgi:hypothetical protein